jgi:hypothetical protein
MLAGGGADEKTLGIDMMRETMLAATEKMAEAKSRRRMSAKELMDNNGRVLLLWPTQPLG